MLDKLAVRDGLLTLPHGPTYRLLVLPALDTMRPAVMRKLHDLVHNGATVLGPPPSRSPSLQDYPHADLEVRRLANELWGETAKHQPGERTFGQGRVVWGKPLDEVFASLGSPPDFESSVPLRFTHRRHGEVDIYFVANPKPEPLTTTAAFRAGAKAPEIWWPDSGRIEHPAVYDVAEGRVKLPLSFGPHGSMFVVFRQPVASATNRIASVRRDGSELLGTRVNPPPARADAATPNHFAFAAWIKPAAATALTAQTNRGTAALS
ncbi:MAG: glycosyl hydrolase [Verrucomicrobia bacterium]|nr:glycosyl hydrolase [Verrucomicrobiota bacterium]